jgi:hypothetical protein
MRCLSLRRVVNPGRLTQPTHLAVKLCFLLCHLTPCFFLSLACRSQEMTCTRKAFGAYKMKQSSIKMRRPSRTKMISYFHGIMRIGFNVTGIYLHLFEYKEALLGPFSEMCLVNVAERIPRVEISDLPWKVSPNLIWKETERRDWNDFVRIISIKSLFLSSPLLSLPLASQISQVLTL